MGMPHGSVAKTHIGSVVWKLVEKERTVRFFLEWSCGPDNTVVQRFN